MKKFQGIQTSILRALVCGTIALLTGCVTTQGVPIGAQLGEALGRAISGAPPQTSAGSGSGSSDPRRGIRSIGESELAGLYTSKPLRMSNGRNAQFPRVAITVDDHFVEQFKLPRPSQCYFMHARIWESAAKSREVAPFTVCGKDIKEPPGGFLRADTTLAGWNSGIASVGGDHTGSTRTEGPRFPQRPLPHGPLDAVGITPSDIAYYFVHGTLTAMNFDFTQADPRVWFVKFGKMDAAGIQSMRASAPSQLETPSKLAAVRVNAQGSESQAANSPKSVAPTTKLQKSSFSKGKEISCTPDVVRPGDTLVIKTSKSYSSLGVKVPGKNGESILLVAGLYPQGLMENAKFEKQMGIDINVAEAIVKPNTRVFTKEGIYSFNVSQNLETDDGTPYFTCKVRYTTK
jgi:hypothetical protein